MSVKHRIAALLAHLNQGVYEKEEELALTLLSSIAGESIFLLGPPGVAKSLIARRLKFAYKDARSFEYLMSRFSTPDEIFGPVSISRLKNNDKYERLTENYLPSAEVVFLDEIWKAGPSIQNALLTVLNERVYRNGEMEIAVPMKALVSASNELPDKDHGLSALWDRFLLRLYVGGVKSGELFNAMIGSTRNSYEDSIPAADKITDSEYHTWSKAIDGVSIPDNIFGVIEGIRNYLSREELYVSDRRWRKIMRLLRASAFLNDRNEVGLMDCFLIRHCIWDETRHIETTAGFVYDAIEKYGYSALLKMGGLKEELAGFQEEIARETGMGEGAGINARLAADTASPVDGVSPAAATDDYCEVLGYPNPQGNVFRRVLRGADFRRLGDSDANITLYYQHIGAGQIMHTELVRARKGQAAGDIVINGSEYSIRIPEANQESPGKKPASNVEGQWDSRIDAFLKRTAVMKEQAQALKQKEAHNVQEHLFVPREAAGTVESHFNLLWKDIEKLELEIRSTRNSYKKIGGGQAPQ
jgi:MoxR-like ATPase